MGKIAFLFSGQGAQKSGMGKSLHDANPAARGVFIRAAAELSASVAKLCFEGPQEELNQTIHTQPCVLTVDLAAAYALFEQGVQPDGCAGFSLGEVAALCCAEVYSLEDTFKLVEIRAKLMQAAAEKTPGGMAAAIGCDSSAVEEICAGIDGVWAVNYNCPGQTVVAGKKDSLEAFIAAASEKKMRVVPLPVSGAFHTEYMRPAAEAFLEEIQAFGNNAPSIPVYSNTYAKPYSGHPTEIREWFSWQMTKPVRWEQTVRRMVEDGFTTFIECGGSTLTGFFKRMKLDGVKAHSVEDEKGLQAAIELAGE